MFDLRALKYFIAAYEEGSITGAARRCFIAQPSISIAIQNLETTLGTILFERTRHGLKPTADGDKLYPRAKDLLAESSAIVQSFTAPPQRELRLQLACDMPVRRAGPLIDLLYRQIPGMQLRLVQESEAFDLKLASDQHKRADEWMLTLWEEDYVALIPGNHPLRFKAQLEPSDLHGAPFIARPECPLSRVFAQAMARKRIQPDIRASVVREEAVPALVDMGVGIALLPESHCEGLMHAVVRPIRHGSELKRKVGLACRADDQQMTRFIRQSKQALLQAYAGNAGQRMRHVA